MILAILLMLQLVGQTIVMEKAAPVCKSFYHLQTLTEQDNMNRLRDFWRYYWDTGQCASIKIGSEWEVVNQKFEKNIRYVKLKHGKYVYWGFARNLPEEYKRWSWWRNTLTK